MTDKYKTIEILLVEDNEDDVELTREALADSKLKNNLNVVNDGVAATDYLFKRSPYENATTPDLILLDLNMPRKNGREVLEEIKAHEQLNRIPVIVMTTSRSDEDILSAYSLHANCYVTKPLNFESFIGIVKSIEDFWFTIVELPKK